MKEAFKEVSDTWEYADSGYGYATASCERKLEVAEYFEKLAEERSRERVD